jgi:hypothetical protein
MSVTDDRELIRGDKALSWSWSANLRHLLLIDEPMGEMLLRRWDEPSGTMRRFRLAHGPQAALDLLNILEAAPAPRAEDVILFALRAFRIVRNSLPSNDGLDSIQVFNLLLTGAEAVCRGQIAGDDWSKCRSVGDALSRLKDSNGLLTEFAALSERLAVASLDSELFRYFLQPEPTTGCRLSPDLLLRHASGQLYQEAHLRLEYEQRQGFLPGMASDVSKGGLLAKDVRLTPPSLARLLVEQALAAAKERINDGPSASVEILDPACGSGVFLQEARRELARRNYSGTVVLRGFDRSPISCAISRFCLERIKLDLPKLNVSIDIKQEDSLQADWGTPDLILMNPPFMPWDRLKETHQDEMVRTILGEDLAKFRVDLAMAFIWKAVKSLAPNASLATVLPAPLLETDSGERWRNAIVSRAELSFLGRFTGYGYFRGSTVEPGMLVVRGKAPVPRREAATVRIVVAKSGCEDAAIRALRRDLTVSSSPTEWDTFTIQQPTLSTASWMPRFRRSMELVEALSAVGMTRVEDLFTVHQGILTGANKAFVLSAEEYQSLPRRERDYFRPAATNSAIRDGRISCDAFVFFPYGPTGRKIDIVEELKKRVPRYYEKWLNPLRDVLAARRGVDADEWWQLTRPRTWQFRKVPKLATTYFGYRGNFGYDDSGNFVVLQGYAWLWKRNTRPEFDTSPLPWAYLAILNSRAFETLLEGACPRVQGGQFNLSARFVNGVFLPNLADNERYTGSLVENLAKFGRQIHDGYTPKLETIDGLTAQAYGMSADWLVEGSVL